MTCFLADLAADDVFLPLPALACKRHLKTVWPRYDISDKEISSVHVFLRGHLR
jgi:hypothetical protein